MLCNTSVMHALAHPRANDHGTHVAGTIVAHNPEKQVFGIAYCAKTMLLKVFWNKYPKPSSLRNDECIAVGHGVHIIKLELELVGKERGRGKSFGICLHYFKTR